MADPAAHRVAIETVWRIESARLIASLTRIVRDVGLAEELAQDALVAALEQWPASGIPENPAAWLMTTARNRAVDLVRRERRFLEKRDEIARGLEAAQRKAGPDVDAAMDDDIGDDLLRLMFTACHPALSPEARVAMTLRLVAGLSTDEIARAFLSPEPTIAQRIVRAKRTLTDKRAEFEAPSGEELASRLESVLEVIYLVFTEGYTATSGEDWIRPGLCEEALRLGRILAGLAPREPEVHGLVALMEIQASRLRARTGPNGEPVLLLDQNRGRWDHVLIRRGLEALRKAQSLTKSHGPYAVQAAIAACHARAARASDTDWRRIAELYAELGGMTGSPVIELNRAVAVSMADGPAEALRIVDRINGDPALADYHLLPSVRGDLLFKLGRLAEARREFERAAGMTRNTRERDLLLARAEGCG